MLQGARQWGCSGPHSLRWAASPWEQVERFAGWSISTLAFPLPEFLLCWAHQRACQVFVHTEPFCSSKSNVFDFCLFSWKGPELI